MKFQVKCWKVQLWILQMPTDNSQSHYQQFYTGPLCSELKASNILSSPLLDGLVILELVIVTIYLVVILISNTIN